MPIKISAMPTNTRPNAANRPFKKPAKMPNTSIGTAAGLRLTLWPASASSQMPPVAPRLVPKITAMPPASPIKPVLKKAMVKSDTKVLDCKTNVAPMPNISPRAGVAVLLAIKRSKVPPAALCSPSSMHCMPNKNNAKP